MEQESTTEELKLAIRKLRAELEYKNETNTRLVSEHQRMMCELNSRRPDPRAHTMAMLALGGDGIFSPLLSNKRRWDRAERLYAEGVKRGHLPKE